ncbi:MAG: hypothetical protein JKY54_06745 [Flavobacteriales bacterium]|nr:hypothetical protein [Flavobacteriales bacterium]
MKIIIASLLLLISYNSFAQAEYSCKDAYTIFNASLVEKDYERAYQYWQRLVDGSCDELIKEKRKVIVNGGLVIKKLIKGAEADRKQNLVDSLIFNYKKGIELLGREMGFVESLGLGYAKYNNDPLKVKELLKESISGLKDKSKSSAVQYYFVAIQKLKIQKKITHKEAVEEYLWLKGIYPNPNVAHILDKVGTTWLDCETLELIYGRQLEETADDVELLKKVLKLLEDKNCQEGNEKAANFYLSVLNKLLILEPSAIGLFSKAKYELSINKKSDAKGTMQKAYELSDDSSGIKLEIIKFGALYIHPKWYDVWNRDFPNDGNPWIYKAREMAKQVNNLKVDPNLTIRRLAYCKAIEYLEKAKRLTPGISNKVDEIIKSYEEQRPSCTELFQLGISVGESKVLPVIGTVIVCCR